MVVLENLPRRCMMKKTAADPQANRVETWIHMRPARLIAVKERMLEFYSD